uniref:Ubiquitinyl hydrolase 1 n=1 Tax=Globodera pallida TaxID=36090 RepID=A0A183BQS4_GLOPA
MSSSAACRDSRRAVRRNLALLTRLSENDGKDDSESDGNESESDESIMNDGPFFKFVRAIVNGHCEQVYGCPRGNSEDLSTFFGYALRIVVETPIELGELGREEETKNVANCADNETTAKADDEKKNNGKDDSESDGNEIESDESIMNDGPFFKFVRAIVNVSFTLFCA